jgi:hypothetical protein
MNRLILLLFLIAVGVYVYIVIYKNNNFFSNFYSEEDNIEPKKVHFSEKNEQFIIPNNDDIKRQQLEQQLELKLHPIDKIDLNLSEENLYDDLFIVNPIEFKNTNLTLSENEYFNNM